MSPIGAVILAAGFARRFGSDKRVQPLGQTDVLTTTVTRYADAFDHLRVVIRNEDQALSERLQRMNCEVVRTGEAHLGMGHTLASGFEDLDWRYAFVALADMPFIRTDTLVLLQQRAAATDYSQILRPRLKAGVHQALIRKRGDLPDYGHPCGFPKTVFNELRHARGDAGARGVFKSHRQLVAEVELEDPGIVVDIDTPEQLADNLLSD